MVLPAEAVSNYQRYSGRRPLQGYAQGDTTPLSMYVPIECMDLTRDLVSYRSTYLREDKYWQGQNAVAPPLP